MLGTKMHAARTPMSLSHTQAHRGRTGRMGSAVQLLQVNKRAVVARVAEMERTETAATSAPVGDLGVEVPKTDKPRIVILGSGWGAISFMKGLDKKTAAKYDVILLSPRNYFLYTPLLPAVATGTMEERSIVEPIRNVMYGKGAYYEAECQSVDPESRILVACFPKDAGFPQSCFRMKYDHLVVSVGSVNNTFGVKGVEEHCFYFKSIHDANRLRSQVSECFERASLPYTTQEERRKLLSFVLVGGGPTGVEVAAEMYDMVNQDMKRLYPDLIPLVRIRVIELMDHVLSTYDRAISDYTGQLFKRNGIELILNSRVSAVEAGIVTITSKDGTERYIDVGACVWATGVAKHPLISQIQEHLPDQTHFRALVTDDHLRVRGSGGSLWAIGDASTVYAEKAFEHADELFEEADVDRTGQLSLGELRGILEKASKRFPQFEEHARFLSVKQGGINRFGGLVGSFFKQKSNSNSNSNGASASPVSDVTEDSKLTREQFSELLETIDKGLRGLPATAQVAGQQGKWLAKSIFSQQAIQQGEALPDAAPSFQYRHKGALAYVGQDRAVADIPQVGPLYGLGAGFVWKGFETYSQFSLRNKVLVSMDWLRAKVFGRDISRV